MGAINYGSNDYINLGYDLGNFSYQEDTFTTDVAIDLISNIIFDDYMYYFKPNIKYGYYEGCYISLDDGNIPLYVDDENERSEILEELETLKNMYYKLTDLDFMCAYIPSWSTAYLNKQDTIKHIDAGIEKLRNEILKIEIDN